MIYEDPVYRATGRTFRIVLGALKDASSGKKVFWLYKSNEIRYISSMVENMSHGFCEVKNKKNFIFANGGYIKFVSVQSSALRGITPDIITFDHTFISNLTRGERKDFIEIMDRYYAKNTPNRDS